MLLVWNLVLHWESLYRIQHLNFLHRQNMQTEKKKS